MVEFEILVEGKLKPADIAVAYHPGQTLSLDPTMSEWIEEVWQKLLTYAEGKGMPLYDGQLFRLESFRCEGGRLSLDLGDTGYKEYVATRQPEFYRNRAREFLANPLAVCATLLTSDGKILVERREGLDVYPNRYHVPGGFFERDKDGDENPHPVIAISREVREETGLSLASEEFLCLGLVYDVLTPHPELCFTATCDVTFDEASRQPGKDGELKHLEYVEDSAEALQEFILKNHGNISATGEPCLLLYGKYRFGGAWYGGLLAAIA